MAVEVKCLLAIDAIAAVYRTGALFRAVAPLHRRR
jgi:hypothetical protein